MKPQSNEIVESEVLEDFKAICTNLKLKYTRVDGVRKIERVKFVCPEVENHQITCKIRDRYTHEFTDEDGFEAEEQIVERYDARNKPQILKAIKRGLDEYDAVELKATVTKLKTGDGDHYFTIRDYHIDSMVATGISNYNAEEAEETEAENSENVDDGGDDEEVLYSQD